MFRRRASSRRVLAPPYKRTATTDDDQWVHASMLRQLFQQDLEHDESKVAVCEVSMALPATGGKAVKGWAAATDRALHVRLALGPGVHQRLRLPYDQVQYVEASASGEASLQVTYFNPERAAHESWHLHWERTVSTPDLGAALVHLVSRHHAPLPEAAPAVGETAGLPARSVPEPVSVLAASSPALPLRRLTRHKVLRAPSPSSS